MIDKIVDKDMKEQYIDSFLLSNSIISIYDLIKTKMNVDDMVDNYLRLQYRYINIPMPRITTSYEIRYGSYVPTKSDPVGNYVARKFDTSDEVEEFYSEMVYVYDRMNQEEKLFFTEHLLNKKSEEYVAEKLGMSRKGLRPIKYSCIIKLAIAFGIEEYIETEK